MVGDEGSLGDVGVIFGQEGEVLELFRVEKRGGVDDEESRIITFGDDLSSEALRAPEVRE